MSLSDSEQRELAFLAFGDHFADADKDSFFAGWDALLDQLGGPDHILKVWPDGSQYTVQHPATERLQKDLFSCQFSQLAESALEHVGPGFYRIWLDRGALLWEEISGDGRG